LEEEALYWGTELYLSDYADHAWSRLLVISSEDAGLASLVGLYVKALNDLYRRNKKSGESRLYFIHAILLLARAPKSRIVDHATIASFEGPRGKRALPD
jgi:replication-associated recombination protein RarA